MSKLVQHRPVTLGIPRLFLPRHAHTSPQTSTYREVSQLRHDGAFFAYVSVQKSLSSRGVRYPSVRKLSAQRYASEGNNILRLHTYKSSAFLSSYTPTFPVPLTIMRLQDDTPSIEDVSDAIDEGVCSVALLGHVRDAYRFLTFSEQAEGHGDIACMGRNLSLRPGEGQDPVPSVRRRMRSRQELLQGAAR